VSLTARDSRPWRASTVLQAQRQPIVLPPPAAPRPEPFAAPSWQGWAWVAAGIGVLCLLARLLRDYAARKHTAR